MTAHESTNC